MGVSDVGWCDGCLGDRRCWVCLGTGRLDGRWTSFGSRQCHRCHGTGRCPLCSVAVMIDLDAQEQVVVEIPEPRIGTRDA